MKSGQDRKKIVAKKAGKAMNGSATTGRYVASGSNKTSSATTTVSAVTYKPGSLLARTGGMVPTVELSKRAAQNIS